MVTEELDDISSPIVRFVRGLEDEDSASIRFSTLEILLNALHDLWWHQRRIGRLRLVGDWLTDHGLFDPDQRMSVLSDLPETVDGLRLARNHLARRADLSGDIDEALVALTEFLGRADDEGRQVRAELVR